ncbi:hypothetical protein [Kribbella sp. CA-294648]|uniref:hypothetical protein n=1 Tax=Kribbella sp. CA-294648 TaxID=3239948 RepID=UPI003D8BFEC2
MSSEQSVDKVLEMVGLTSVANKRAGAYSLGMSLPDERFETGRLLPRGSTDSLKSPSALTATRSQPGSSAVSYE